MTPVGGPTGADRHRTWVVWSLAAVVILAAVLRCWGLWYGLPNPLARPDEEIVVGHAVALAFGEPDPTTFPQPGLLYTKTAVTGLPIRPDVGLVFPYPDLVYDVDALALQPWKGAILAGRTDLAYRVCRSMTAAAGVATVLAAFFAAWHAYRRRSVALVAGLLVAVNFLHARDSHYATVDVPLALLVTLALGFALKAQTTARRGDVWRSAGLAGLAASAKFNGAVVIFSTVTAVVNLARPLVAGRRWRRAAATLAVAALVMGAAFAITSPWCVRHYQIVALGLRHQREVLFGSEGPAAWKIFLGSTFPGAFGWPGFVAVGAGVLRAIWKRRASDLVLLAFIVPTFLSMAAMTWVLPRYPILLLPALSVLAAEAAIAMLPSPRSAWTLAAVAALAAPPLVSIVAYDRLASQTDTRVLASEWMAGHLPRGARVAICRGYGAPVPAEPAAFTAVDVPCTLDAIRGAGARYVVTHDHPYVQWFGPSEDASAWLEAHAARLAIVTPFRAEAGMAGCFYAGDAFYLPSCRFDQLDRGGPIVTVWDLGEARR